MTFNLLRQVCYRTNFNPNNVLRLGNSLTSKTVTTNTHIKSTVDDDDVQRHSIITDWWDTSGSLRGLHSFNRLRVPFVRDGLVSEANREKTLTPLADKKILDIGCGAGILSESLARIGAAVTGVDASQDLIQLAKEHSDVDPKIANNKPMYYFTTIENHSVQFRNNYDAVVASEIIEHVTDKELFLQSCIETLKPGGKIFITTPSKSRLSQIWNITIGEYVGKFIPRGTHEYKKFVSPQELVILLEKNNCKVEIIRGVIYNPLKNHWRWCNSTALVFVVQARKLQL